MEKEREGFMKIAFHTIGCRLNQYETAVIRNTFDPAEYTVVPVEEPADIVVINTCTVTHKSDTDTRRFITRLRKLNPHVSVALIGCQAQLQAAEMSRWPNVRWVIGNARKFDLARILEEFKASPSVHIETPAIGRAAAFSNPSNIFGIDPEHTRANLKIQDGCDFFCTFCEIPFARGRARSREFQDIIREAKALAGAGHQEIILTGINLGTYQHADKSLLDIIKALDDIPKIKRVRISSIEPLAIPKGLTGLMASKTKLCRYLHLPVQSLHDGTLKAMKRRYSVLQVKNFVRELSDNVPSVCLGTDVIVGFPGEAADHFDETYHQLKELPFHYIHVFSYSDRPHAKSRTFAGKVDVPEIKRRSQKLRDLSRRKRLQFYRSAIGTIMSVLFEQTKDGLWQGLTDNFIPVSTQSEKSLKNTIKPVTLQSADHSGIQGTLHER